MIKKYNNGNDLIEENDGFLKTNKDLSAFFYLDAPLLNEVDQVNYALQVTCGEQRLLAMKVEPYNLLLFGSSDCVKELLDYLFNQNYEVKGMLCSEDLGEKLSSMLKNDYNISYCEALAMDFMEARKKTEPTSTDVISGEEADTDEIFECLQKFVVDCGLLDKANRKSVEKGISNFRLLKKDGLIISMAKMIDSSDESMRISDVYTRNEYRGKGYARKVVNAVKNDILDKGKIATLNVDKKNPISYHLYLSLGFERVFSQGEYRRVEKP